MTQSIASILIRRRRLGQLALGGLLGAAVSPTSWAQGAGAQLPLRLVVPFTPGTGIDLIARQIGPASPT